jgi:hypothetical protein
VRSLVTHSAENFVCFLLTRSSENFVRSYLNHFACGFVDFILDFSKYILNVGMKNINIKVMKNKLVKK